MGGSNFVERKASGPPQQQQPVPASVFKPAAQASSAAAPYSAAAAASTAGTDARKQLLQSRHRSYGRSRNHRGFGSRDYSRQRDTMYGHRKSSRIRPDVADQGRVVRTYRTVNAPIENTVDVDHCSFAWSFALTALGGFAIKIGGPSSGSNVVSDTLNDEFAADFANFMNVFRYFKLTKISMHVEKLPLWTTMPGQVVWNATAGAANQEQLGNAGNIFSPGRFLMRPWAGEPGVCDYSDGVLVGNPWQDNIKYKTAKTSPACSGLGGTFSQTYTPMSQYAEDQIEGIIPVPAGGVDYQIKYQRTPAIEYAAYSTNRTSCLAFGGVFVWFFPSSVGAANGQLCTSCWWEFEIEYFGLDIPVDPTTTAIAASKAGVQGQYAELGLVDMKSLPDPPKSKRESAVPPIRMKPPPNTPSGMEEDYDHIPPDIAKLTLKKQ